MLEERQRQLEPGSPFGWGALTYGDVLAHAHFPKKHRLLEKCNRARAADDFPIFSDVGRGVIGAELLAVT